MDLIDSGCKRSYDGKINLILGNMFSGKSSALISRCIRYQIGGKKCMLIKYGRDNRYNETKIITHDKRYVVDAIPCVLLCEVDYIVKEYDVICIDEIQFFKDAHIFCNKWANLGKIVEAGGLNGKFNLESWDVINKLLPLAYDIEFNRAVCKQTGNDAIFSHRIVASEEDELIGGEDMYQASDRPTFFQHGDKIYQRKDFEEFANIYIKEHDVKLNTDDISQLIKYFENIYEKSSDNHLLFKNVINNWLRLKKLI